MMKKRLYFFVYLKKMSLSAFQDGIAPTCRRRVPLLAEQKLLMCPILRFARVRPFGGPMGTKVGLPPLRVVPRNVTNSFSIGIFVIFFFLFEKSRTYAQISFFNSGVHITVTPNCTTYIGGDLLNAPLGFIHNNGNIFLTGDWTNNEPSGCLDPATGTVTLFGGNQSIQGSQSTTFNNLDCQGNGTKTLFINTIAGGNIGILSLNANPLNLNSNTLIITNPSPSAVMRTAGYIISETDASAGYGTIQWNIDISGAGNNYIFPFGTTTGEYIPLNFNITAPGITSGGPPVPGIISAATYPTGVTSNPNNRPLPAGVTDLTDISTWKDVSEKCNDRFWITAANNYFTNPTADITFTYRDAEWDASGGSTNIIVEDSLRGWRWNGLQWLNPSAGIANPAANTVSVPGVNIFSAWTLFARDESVCGPLYIPNAFSPNEDGENDVFRPLNNCFSKIRLMIFNRWGEKVFETENISESWDGNYQGKFQDTGVFVYILDYELTTAEKGRKKGNISLLR